MDDPITAVDDGLAERDIDETRQSRKKISDASRTIFSLIEQIGALSQALAMASVSAMARARDEKNDDADGTR